MFLLNFPQNILSLQISFPSNNTLKTIPSNQYYWFMCKITCNLHAKKYLFSKSQAFLVLCKRCLFIPNFLPKTVDVFIDQCGGKEGWPAFSGTRQSAYNRALGSRPASPSSPPLSHPPWEWRGPCLLQQLSSAFSRTTAGIGKYLRQTFHSALIFTSSCGLQFLLCGSVKRIWNTLFFKVNILNFLKNLTVLYLLDTQTMFLFSGWSTFVSVGNSLKKL